MKIYLILDFFNKCWYNLLTLIKMLTNSFKEQLEEEKSESPDNYIPVHSSIDNNYLTRPSAIIRKDNDLT